MPEYVKKLLAESVDQKYSQRTTVNLKEAHKDFLHTIIFEDAATSLSGAVEWCIDACMRIEAFYGVDACYVAFNDIRLPENQPKEE